MTHIVTTALRAAAWGREPRITPETRRAQEEAATAAANKRDVCPAAGDDLDGDDTAPVVLSERQRKTRDAVGRLIGARL